MKRLKTADARESRVAVAPQSGAPDPAAPVVGRVVGVNERGALLVEVEDGQPVPARAVSGIAAGDAGELLGREVLVVYERGDVARPIVTAVMPSAFESELRVPEGEEAALDARIDGDYVTLEARRRLVLRCGKASIVIDADGKITIRGAHLFQRSTGPIRIKGGHVDIN